MQGILKRLSKIFNESEVIFYDDQSKFILMSDCHRGTGGFEDNFSKNQKLYSTALEYYYNEGYTYIELGDGDELWENKKINHIIDEYRNIFYVLRKFYNEKRLYFIYGNHDMVKKKTKYVKKNLYKYYNERENKDVNLFDNIKIHEGIVLSGTGENEDNKMFLIHGHQGDFINDYIWKIARFLVRYLWKPLEIVGVRDPTKVVKNYNRGKCVYNNMSRWADKEKKIIITGHTHKPSFAQKGTCTYFNTGSCVHPRCITGIEIMKGNIMLVKWAVKVKKDGYLYIGKDIIGGPTKISDYFNK